MNTYTHSHSEDMQAMHQAVRVLTQHGHHKEAQKVYALALSLRPQRITLPGEMA